ncbi:angiopoietin-4 isoform X2 [Mesocricetus auratus]|uniref:Angiopoietin-4 isoform X2 n=1 Tax=Mesocricetus auratus TaxID=10036 RepID=A0A1U7QF33_MESAU|nr:angiopoietin-4 isoform X2 [Mesocricetus auratus]
MLCQPAMLLGGLILLVTTAAAQQRGPAASGRRQIHRVQHGQCSYTFVLPEPSICQLAPEAPDAFGGSNSLQRDLPASRLPLADFRAQRAQRVRQLEKMLENNTQWLLKLEQSIRRNLRSNLAQARQHTVQNQTTTMLSLGANLMNQTTAQTHKLTAMEAQVLNQTSRMKLQMLENSLSTNKLERQVLMQSHELQRLQGRNRALESRLQALEAQHQAQMNSLQDKREQLQSLLGHQTGALANLKHNLQALGSNSSSLKQQQQQLMELVQRLVRIVAQDQRPATLKTPKQLFQDCAEIKRSGANASGIYTIRVANMTRPLKVFCDMETDGGGWTLIQRRQDGSMSFQRTWEEYKEGFGNVAGELWLGNEAVHHLTSRTAHLLRVELHDWEGRQTSIQYEHFQLGNERQRYSLLVNASSSSTGLKNSLAPRGTKFSTSDMDNDNCMCKCAQMMSGGWWFDACGLSNLNGIYYPVHQHLHKINGIRWHYFRGPSYSLHGTRMMLRPMGA